MKNKRVKYNYPKASFKQKMIGYSVCVVACIVFLLIAIVPLINKQGMVSCTATVISHDDSHTLIHYIFEGRMYENTLNHWSDTYSIGGTIKIMLDPANPLKIEGDSAVYNIVPWIGAGIFGAIGIGGFTYEIVRGIRKSLGTDKLLEEKKAKKFEEQIKKEYKPTIDE